MPVKSVAGRLLKYGMHSWLLSWDVELNDIRKALIQFLLETLYHGPAQFTFGRISRLIIALFPKLN